MKSDVMCVCVAAKKKKKTLLVSSVRNANWQGTVPDLTSRPEGFCVCQNKEMVSLTCSDIHLHFLFTLPK